MPDEPRAERAMSETCGFLTGLGPCTLPANHNGLHNAVPALAAHYARLSAPLRPARDAEGEDHRSAIRILTDIAKAGCFLVGSENHARFLVHGEPDALRRSAATLASRPADAGPVFTPAELKLVQNELAEYNRMDQQTPVFEREKKAWQKLFEKVAGRTAPQPSLTVKQLQDALWQTYTHMEFTELCARYSVIDGNDHPVLQNLARIIHERLELDSPSPSLTVEQVRAALNRQAERDDRNTASYLSRLTEELNRELSNADPRA